MKPSHLSILQAYSLVPIFIASSNIHAFVSHGFPFLAKRQSRLRYDRLLPLRYRSSAIENITQVLFSSDKVTNNAVPTVESNKEGEDSNNEHLYDDFPFIEDPQIRERKRAVVAATNFDPSFVDFKLLTPPLSSNEEIYHTIGSVATSYPFSAMMQGCAPYIASHAAKTAVFHIPGELITSKQHSDHLFSDIALSWLLGMKIVIVASCRYDADTCNVDLFGHPHECLNSLQATDAASLRRMQEEAGYLRTEVERKLNKYLQQHYQQGSDQEGNVVSGNFYTAQRLGSIQGHDFKFTGFCSEVHVDSMTQFLENNNDVVLLTTVGMNSLGDLVTVNGYHLAASVAASLAAHKLIYMANEGCILERKECAVNATDNSNDNFCTRVPIQELPLSFAKCITEHYDIRVHKTGYAIFDTARHSLDPAAVELLLHLGWASWSLERGVQRAHIVNPKDGALLEELFTTEHGANTCIYHDCEDEEVQEVDILSETGAEGMDTVLRKEVWDSFLSTGIY